MSSYMSDLARNNLNKPSRSEHDLTIPKELSHILTASDKPTDEKAPDESNDASMAAAPGVTTRVNMHSKRVDEIKQRDLIIKPLCIDIRLDEHRKFVFIKALVKLQPEDDDTSEG